MIKDWLEMSTIINFIQANPEKAYLLAFLTSFSESLAIVGAIVPGAVFMSVIGFLVGSGLMNGKITYFYLTLGVLAGDFISFSFGALFRTRIKYLWPFTRWPQLLVNGTKFFQKHGGKSVCIGRFIGPVRAVIPMIAGMLRMPFIHFFCYTFPSAILWAISYTVPGWLLGALALELPKKVVLKFVGFGFLTLIIVWGVVWLLRGGLQWLKLGLNFILRPLWEKLFNSAKYQGWFKNSFSPNRAYLLSTRIFWYFLFFIGLALLVFTRNPAIQGIDRIIYALLSNLRTAWFDKLMILVTSLGDLSFLLGFAGLVLLGFIYFCRWRESIFWAASIMVSVGIIIFLKYLGFLPRPSMIGYKLTSSSFPSAHVTLSAIIYGFLAIILATTSKKRHYFWVVGIVVIAIAISRLYLGAHWFSDVVAGALLAGGVLSTLTLVYEREPVASFVGVKKLLWFLLGIGGGWWLFNFVIDYNSQQYTLVWPKQILSFGNLINYDYPFLIEREILGAFSFHRTNRLGQVVEPLNLLYVGSLSTFEKNLLEQNWQNQEGNRDLKKLLRLAISPDLNKHFTLFAPLYHGRAPNLVLTREGEAGCMYIIKLWKADIDFIDLDATVWLGNIEYHHPLPYWFSLSRLKILKDPVFFEEAEEILTEGLPPTFQVIRLPIKGKNNFRIKHLWVIKE